MVILSRTIPPFPAAKLRASHQLLELSASDLAFSREEAREFLSRSLGHDLTDKQVDILWKRTEGWITGLRIAAHLLQFQPDGDGEEQIEAFSGQNRFVFDYFAEQILDHVPPQVLTFMLRTSVLNRFCAPLCDTVTKGGASALMLERIEHAGLFLIPLDDRREWYRFHTLFADALQYSRRRTQPALEMELRRRASRWCETNGQMQDAIDYAFAANEPARAARLLDAYVMEALARDEQALILSKLNQLPDRLISKHTRLAVAHAYTILMVDGDRSLVGQRVLDAERSLRRQTPELSADNAVLRAEVLTLGTAFRFLSGASSVGELIMSHRRVLGALPRVHWLRNFTLWFLGIEQLADGAAREAFGTLDAMVRACEAQGRPRWVGRGFLYLGLALLQVGRLDEALARSFRIGHYLANFQDADLSARVNLIEGKVYYERNELDKAVDHLSRGISLRYDPAPFLIEGYSTLAFAQRALGRADTARQLFEQSLTEWTALQAEGAAVWAWTSRRIRANQARLSLLEGDVGAVSAWARSVEQSYASATASHIALPGRVREDEAIVLARTYLARNRIHEALSLLGKLHELAASAGRRNSELEILILQAVAHDANEDIPAAIRSAS